MTTETPAKPRMRRSASILIALVLCVAALAIYQVRRTRAGEVASVSPSAAARSRDGSTLGEAPPDVRLDALEPEWPALVESARNPFRFQPRASAAPARPAAVAQRPLAPPSVAGGPGGAGGAGAPVVQAPPPIPLKFIGAIEAPGVGKIAALSDGKFVYHGREGDIIEGRYRIVKIGVESIVMEHADGRGRQTIRLTG